MSDCSNKPCLMEISLEKLRFHAHHGVMEQERVVGNEYEVSMTVTVPCTADTFAEEGESPVENTISYADLYSIIESEMKMPRQLLETVATRIAKAVTEQYPILTSGSVKITKTTPPIPGIDGSASVKLIF